MREWKVDRSETIYSHYILELSKREISSGGEHREVLVMGAPEWINVVPLLDDGRVVLVRQWRFGIQSPTLEIPGGMVDAGEDARAAAARELLEETGYRAGRLELLGSMHPNPAFIDNRLTTWLASDLTLEEPDRRVFGVDGEEIRCETVPLEEIPRLVARGEITHSLVIAGFYLLQTANRGRPAAE